MAQSPNQTGPPSPFHCLSGQRRSGSVHNWQGHIGDVAPQAQQAKGENAYGHCDENGSFQRSVGVCSCDRSKRHGQTGVTRQSQRDRKGCRRMWAGMVARPPWSLSSDGEGSSVPERVPPWSRGPAVLAKLTALIRANGQLWRAPAGRWC